MSAARRLFISLVTAALTLLSAEVGVRIARGTVELPYEPGERAYRAFGPEVRQFGAAEIAIVGNSRAREALLVPELRSALAPTDRQARIGNYSLAGAQAADVEVVVRRLLEAEPPPKLVVYGISPRQLAVHDDGLGQKLPFLWRVTDWYEARQRLGARADALLPDAIKNSLADASLLASFRWEFVDAMRDVRRPVPLFYAAKRLTLPGLNDRFDPMRGSLPKWQQGGGKNATRKVSSARIREYLGRRFDDESWPRTWQLDHVRRLLEACQQASVRVVLVEVPVRDDLLRHLPEGVDAQFREAIREVTAAAGVRFVEWAPRGVKLEFRHWRDQSHLNLRGATAYTRAVAEIVALEAHEALSPKQ